jgi:hypothetical protein
VRKYCLSYMIMLESDMENVVSSLMCLYKFQLLDTWIHNETGHCS